MLKIHDIRIIFIIIVFKYSGNFEIKGIISYYQQESISVHITLIIDMFHYVANFQIDHTTWLNYKIFHGKMNHSKYIPILQHR